MFRVYDIRAGGTPFYIGETGQDLDRYLKKQISKARNGERASRALYRQIREAQRAGLTLTIHELEVHTTEEAAKAAEERHIAAYIADGYDLANVKTGAYSKRRRPGMKSVSARLEENLHADLIAVLGGQGRTTAEWLRDCATRTVNGTA